MYRADAQAGISPDNMVLVTSQVNKDSQSAYPRPLQKIHLSQPTGSADPSAVSRVASTRLHVPSPLSSTAAASAARADDTEWLSSVLHTSVCVCPSGGIRAWYFECENTCVYHGVSHDDWCDPSMFVCSGTLEKVAENGSRLISSGASPSLPPRRMHVVTSGTNRLLSLPGLHVSLLVLAAH